jgi:hypothetical protein
MTREGLPNMVRYIVAAILGCLYAAGSIWLVSSQGQAYRDALNREKRAAVPSKATSPRPIEEVVTVAPTLAAPEPRSPRPEPTTTKPPAAAVADRPVKPAEPKSPPAPVVAIVAEAKPNPASPPPADRATGAAAGKAANPATRPPELDPVWDQAPVKKTWDLARLSAQDEVRLGADLHDLIVQFNRPVESGGWQRRVEEAAEPFLKARSRKEIPYTFTVLDSDAVNAFSTPGGFVYVSRGLFNLIGEDEDYALEFVVGHEIAHVDLQHALKCLRDPDVMKMTEGTLQKLYVMIIPFAYPDPLEFEADSWVYARMRQLGRTDRESLMFLRKLEGHAKAHDFENGRGRPQLGRDASPLENHFRAHTAAWKRLKQLKELTGKASSSPK